MSKVSRCSKCGGNIVEPAFEGDGAYPVAPMCTCGAPDESPLCGGDPKCKTHQGGAYGMTSKKECRR